MKTMHTISAAIAAIVLFAYSASAAEVVVQPGVGVSVNAAGVNVTAPTAPDWRYKYQGNRWWYYTPENRWMYYTEPGGWVYYQPGYTTYYGSTDVPSTTYYSAPAYSYYSYPTLGAYWGYPRYYGTYGRYYGSGWRGRGYGWGRRW